MIQVKLKKPNTISFHLMVITNGKVGVGEVEVGKGGINVDRR